MTARVLRILETSMAGAILSYMLYAKFTGDTELVGLKTAAPLSLVEMDKGMAGNK